MKPTDKCKAIVNIKLDVFHLLESGECSGNRIPDDELKNYGIKPNNIISVDGNNRHECLTKLAEAIKGFKK